jgi:hypothetical protein
VSREGAWYAVPSTTSSAKLLIAIAPTFFFRIVFLLRVGQVGPLDRFFFGFHLNDAITTRHFFGLRKWSIRDHRLIAGERTAGPEFDKSSKKFCFFRALELCFAPGHLNIRIGF